MLILHIGDRHSQPGVARIAAVRRFDSVGHWDALTATERGERMMPAAGPSLVRAAGASLAG